MSLSALFVLRPLLSKPPVTQAFLRELDYFQGILFLTTNLLHGYNRRQRLPLARQYSSDRPSSRLKPVAETPRPASRKPDLPLQDSSTDLTDADREQLAAWEFNGREIKECYRHGEHVVSL